MRVVEFRVGILVASELALELGRGQQMTMMVVHENQLKIYDFAIELLCNGESFYADLDFIILCACTFFPGNEFLWFDMAFRIA